MSPFPRREPFSVAHAEGAVLAEAVGVDAGEVFAGLHK